MRASSTIFTGGGSNDPQDINQWAWKDGSGGLPDKDNLLHAFAARYSLPADAATCPGKDGGTTCDVLFFGSDRLDNSGDAQQGFWFFQNAISRGTNAVGGGKGFVGSNSDDSSDYLQEGDGSSSTGSATGDIGGSGEDEEATSANSGGSDTSGQSSRGS